MLVSTDGVMAGSVSIGYMSDPDPGPEADDTLRLVYFQGARLRFQTYHPKEPPDSIEVPSPLNGKFLQPTNYLITDTSDGMKPGDQLAWGNVNNVATIYFASDDEKGNLPKPPDWVAAIKTTPWKGDSGSFMAVQSAPEPSTWVLLGTGAIGLLTYVQRRRRQAPASDRRRK
jgi:hypothetical protein